MSVSVENTVFRDVTPCRPLEVHRRFAGIYFLVFIPSGCLEYTSTTMIETFLRNVGKLLPDYMVSHPCEGLRSNNTSCLYLRYIVDLAYLNTDGLR
jgi:hypothetical protein